MREFGPSALPWRRTYLGLSAGMSLAIAACTGSGGPQAEAKPTSTPTYSTTLTSAETKPISTPTPNISPLNSSFELPFSGTWYFTKGPHSDDLSRGMRYALYFAPPEIIPCPSGKPLEGRYVTAAALGKVTVVGNEKDPADKNHSIVEIQHPNGYTTGYMHLENIKPRVGQEVKQGDILGNPSCEYPPGGKISVEHLQFYLKRAGLPVRISEISLSGYKITEGDREGLGNLSKPGEKTRTPDQRGCDNDQICGGIRNDLTSSSKPLSESVAKPAIKPKFEVPQPTAAPKPVSKPTQAPVPRLEQGFTTFTSALLPYRINYPQGWKFTWSDQGGTKTDAFTVFGSGETVASVSVSQEQIRSWVTAENYRDNYLTLLKQRINTNLPQGAAILKPYSRIVNGIAADGIIIDFAKNQWTGTIDESVSLVFKRRDFGWIIMLNASGGKDIAAAQSYFRQVLRIFETMVDSLRFLD